MNKLKLYEAMNLIDDDIIEEAAENAEVSQPEMEAEPEITVSGVEHYSRPVWRRFAAIAASVLLAAGLCAAGGVYLKNRKFTENDDVIAAPTSSTIVTKAEDSLQTEAGTEGDTGNSTNGADENTTETATETQSYNDTETTIVTDLTTTGTVTGTTVTTVLDTTGPARQTTTTAVTTKNSIITTYNNVLQEYDEPTGEGPLTLRDLILLSKKGKSLDWDDFEGYDHEDIGSGLYIWKFDISEGEGYTLLVGGVPHYGEPNYILLCRTADYLSSSPKEISTKDKSIEIRSSDVEEFLNRPARMLDAWKPFYAIQYADSVSKADVSYSMFKERAVLSYDQIKLLIENMRNVELIAEDNSWEAMSGNYSNVRLELKSGETLQFGVMGSFIIIDGQGYKAEYSACEAINNLVYSAVHAANVSVEKLNIGKGEVWCWHDLTHENGDGRYIAETIELENFPGYKFNWIGTKYCIEIEKDGEQPVYVSGQPLWNAFFTDITGDGYPDLCTTASFGSGIINNAVEVYDIKNGKRYNLSSRGKYDYNLSLENGQLAVYEFVNDSQTHGIFDGSGHRGNRVYFSEENGIFFAGDQVTVTVKVKEISGNTLFVTPIDGSWERSQYETIQLPASYLSVTPAEGMVLLVNYSGAIAECYPPMFSGITNVKVMG